MMTYDTGNAGGGANGPWNQQQYQPRLGRVTLVYEASMSVHKLAERNLFCKQRSVSAGAESAEATKVAKAVTVETRIFEDISC